MPRATLLAIALLLVSDRASAVDPSELAPPGLCAGEERDIELRAKGALPSGDEGTSTGGPSRLHLSPLQVAGAAGPAPALPLPAAPSMVGPGPCDQPGSGCAGEVKVFDDPNPGTGCGFPGSPCP